jgi:hypothetical protein
MSPVRDQGRALAGAPRSWSFVWPKFARWFSGHVVFPLPRNVDLLFKVVECLQDISKYSSFAMLPSDLSQQIFDELVDSKCLTEALLEKFRDCALHVRFLLPIFFSRKRKKHCVSMH